MKRLVYESLYWMGAIVCAYVVWWGWFSEVGGHLEMFLVGVLFLFPAVFLTLLALQLRKWQREGKD